MRAIRQVKKPQTRVHLDALLAIFNSKVVAPWRRKDAVACSLCVVNRKVRFSSPFFLGQAGLLGSHSTSQAGD